MLKKIIHKSLEKLGYTKCSQNLDQGYISAIETIEKAKENNQSVYEYVENIWDCKGNTKLIIDNITKHLPNNIDYVCEIGTGTGRYAEEIINYYKPKHYESYETAKDWAEWLSKEYHIISHNADGKSLKNTKENSIELIHAHGVFVYLPFILTCCYFEEMIRVIKQNGYLVFDIYSEKCFTDELLKKWINSGHYYPHFLSSDFVITFFRNRGFKFVADFFNPKYGAGISHYLVFQKKIKP